MKKIEVAPILLICASVFGCENSAATHRIQFVDRNQVSSHALTPQPLMLIVEIDAGGRLRLNKIETGTISDVSDLSEKIKVIFDDREKRGINEREVLIDSKINAEGEGFEKLLKTLADLKASPIRVIKNDR